MAKVINVRIGGNDTELIGDRFILTPKARLNYFPHVGCIFIHIPKTGGTSISSMLTQLDEYLRIDGEPSKFEVPLRRHYKHTKGLVYREKLERTVWDKSFKFCVVRNPFDQMVSSYEWWRQKGSDYPHTRAGAHIVKRLGSYKAFLAHELGEKRINECVGQPEDWFLDDNGRDLVDFIVPFEKIDELLKSLGAYVKVPPGLRVPMRNATKRREYSYYYDTDSIARMRERFNYVIDRFDYHVDF